MYDFAWFPIWSSKIIFLRTFPITVKKQIVLFTVFLLLFFCWKMGAQLGQRISKPLWTLDRCNPSLAVLMSDLILSHSQAFENLTGTCGKARMPLGHTRLIKEDGWNLRLGKETRSLHYCIICISVNIDGFWKVDQMSSSVKCLVKTF